MNHLSQAICAHANLLTMKRYDLVAVMLYGSQNYECDTPRSDVDSKAIVMPSINNLIHGTRVNPKVIPSLGGQVDVKDIRDMCYNYLKSNINFLETLYTKTYFVNPYYQQFMQELRAHRDLFANYSPSGIMRASAGMAIEKFKRLYHLTPATKEEILQYGYNRKELSHMVRLHYFMRDYSKGVPFAECLIPKLSERKTILSLKTEQRIERDVKEISEKTIHSIEMLLANAPIMEQPNNPEAKEMLNCIMEEAVLKHMETLMSIRGMEE